MKIKTLTDTRQSWKDLDALVHRRHHFQDQFNSFTANLSIDAETELELTNNLRDLEGNKIIPGEWRVIDARGAAIGALTRGDTEWTEDHLYLKNTSVLNGNFKVRFFEKEPQDERITSDPDTAQLVDSFTVFDGPTTGSFELPTSFASPTLSDAVFECGNPVTRSTNTLNFPLKGCYLIIFEVSALERTTGADMEVLARIRNTTLGTTDSVESAIAVGGNKSIGQTFLLHADVTNTTHDYEIQWVAESTKVEVMSITIDGESSPQWRLSIILIARTS